MLTRRGWLFGALFAPVAVPHAVSAAQPAAAPPVPPLRWKMVVDRATYDVADLDPPLLPAPPGRVAIRYRWEEDDKIEAWWQAVIEGDHEPKSMILYALRGKSKKAIISYALGGVELTLFKGPSLARDGGYSGPSTAYVTFQSVRVLPH